jgi:hypothetical protein
MTAVTNLVVLVVLQPATPEAGSIHYSYAYGKRFAFTVGEADIRKAPQWGEGDDNPPLSARKALKAANDELKGLVPQTADWTLESLNLHKWRGDDSRWYYIASFVAKPQREKPTALFTSDGQPRSLRIPILMNGTAVHPEVTPWKR